MQKSICWMTLMKLMIFKYFPVLHSDYSKCICSERELIKNLSTKCLSIGKGDSKPKVLHGNEFILVKLLSGKVSVFQDKVSGLDERHPFIPNYHIMYANSLGQNQFQDFAPICVYLYKANQFHQEKLKDLKKTSHQSWVWVSNLVMEEPEDLACR